MEYIKNNIQIILIVVVGILVATNIFTFTQVTALEKDLNVKVEQIDTEIALQSKSIQFIQTDLGYLEKHMHWTAYQLPKGASFTPEAFNKSGIKYNTEELSELFCSTNLYPDRVPSGGNSGEMLIIRDQDETISWNTVKCE